MGSSILSGLRALKPSGPRVLPLLVHILLILRSLVVGLKVGWRRIKPIRLKDSDPVVDDSSTLGSLLQEVKRC